MVDIRGTSEVGGTRITTGGRDDSRGEVRGARGGDVVELEKDAIALAQDLKEEIGELVSDEMESELGREERRLDKSEEVLHDAIIAEVTGAEEDELTDVSGRQDEIEALAQELKDAGAQDPDEILQHLKDNLGSREGERGPNDDPALQFGALKIMERMFTRRGDSEMAEAIKGATARLLEQSGNEIQKGVIVTKAAVLHSSDTCGSVSELRSLYLNEVVGYKGIPGAFNSIIEKHGEKGFSEAVAFLLRAAGDDLSTMTRDTDRAQQKEVIDNLYQLEVLNTMRERTDGMLQQIGKHFPLGPDASPQKVMRDTFGMIETPMKMVESNVTRIAQDTVPESIEGRISFLREYRNLANMIPIKVFDEVDGSGGGLRLRERLGEAILAAQDVADAEEQEKLNSQ